ncbi:MAG TPA: surface-adhesin E family protein [Thermodesulfobacteriota bacterium]|nr:surface-adhesin E family protein [Thermodesulfobacteriota bacterium]
MKSLSVKLRVILIGLIIFSYAEVWGADWRYYGTNEDGSYFYDTESMARSSKNLIEVWVQSAYSEKGISHWVREGGKGFQDLDFSLTLLELNCAERSARYLQIVFYSKNGRVFYPFDNDEWQLIAPDSMILSLHKEVCK